MQMTVFRGCTGGCTGSCRIVLPWAVLADGVNELVDSGHKGADCHHWHDQRLAPMLADCLLGELEAPQTATPMIALEPLVDWGRDWPPSTLVGEHLRLGATVDTEIRQTVVVADLELALATAEPLDQGEMRWAL